MHSRDLNNLEGMKSVNGAAALPPPQKSRIKMEEKPQINLSNFNGKRRHNKAQEEANKFVKKTKEGNEITVKTCVQSPTCCMFASNTMK
jgi:hypothetical protein